MIKFVTIAIAALVINCSCRADTFTNLRTGESFNGYYLQKQKSGKTQVKIDNRSPKYIDLKSYRIEKNYLGRKNKVNIFTIKNSTEFLAEAEAFDKALEITANQGPLFILIEIDAAQLKPQIALRLAKAIQKTKNCSIFAFLDAKKAKGAFAEASTVALVCDKIYLSPDAGIGGGVPYNTISALDYELKQTEVDANDIRTQLTELAADAAEQFDRDKLLIRAMTEKDIQVVEIEKDAKMLLVDNRYRQKEQLIINTLNRKNQSLTLNATQALKYGIAEKIVDSTKQLMIALNADQAKILKDTRVLKAKRRATRARKKFEAIFNPIKAGEQSVAALANQLRSAETKITQGNERRYREGFDLSLYDTSYDQTDLREWEQLLIRRDQLVRLLIDALGDLMRDYKKAIPIAKMHPDLIGYLNTLEQGLAAAETAYTDARARTPLNIGFF